MFDLFRVLYVLILQVKRAIEVKWNVDIVIIRNTNTSFASSA